MHRWKSHFASRNTPHTSHTTPHTQHLTHNTSHPTPHTSHLTHNTSHLTPHLTPHASHTQHLTHNTSHTTPHTSHTTHNTSHLTPHTSHTAVTSYFQKRAKGHLHQTSCETGNCTKTSIEIGFGMTHRQAFAGVMTFPTFSFRVLSGIID